MSATVDPTVLLVDDESALLDLYIHFIEDDYTVRTAESGVEALSQMDDSIDVVLLDRRMPEMSGDEVLNELRNRRYDCLVAMVSAVEPDFDVIEMGFDDYLVKPITQEKLYDLIETLLTRATHDEVVREYFAIVSKRALLEAEMTIETLEDSDEYAELTRRLEEVKAEAETLLAEMSDDEIGALFRELGPDPDSR